VGEWMGARFKGQPFPQETAENLELWEAWVRAATLDFELLSHLRFTWHRETFSTLRGARKSALTATVWHVDETAFSGGVPKLTSKPLVSMIAPEPATFVKQLSYVNGYA